MCSRGIIEKASGITDMDGHRADTDFIPDRVSDSKQAASTKRITSQVVTALKPPVAGNRVVCDQDLTGFGVRITAAGAVSFVLRYVLHGRERRYTIGRHPDLSPGAARLCDEMDSKVAGALWNSWKEIPTLTQDLPVSHRISVTTRAARSSSIVGYQTVLSAYALSAKCFSIPASTTSLFIMFLCSVAISSPMAGA